MHVQSPTKEKVNNCCCCYVVAIDTEPSVKDTTHLWSQNALSQNGYGERERGMCGCACGGVEAAAMGRVCVGWSVVGWCSMGCGGLLPWVGGGCVRVRGCCCSSSSCC